MYTHTTEHVKYCVMHPDCQVTVIADPLLTVSLPPHLTAWTGMDALTHAIEAYSVDSFHPMCDGIALESMRMITESLPLAVTDGENLEARSQMLVASSMAAVAFQKGLGAVHGLSEPIGAVYDTQHGLTNAVLLPYVLRANRNAIEPKCELIARYLGLPGASVDGYQAVLDWVDSMCERLEIPSSLKEIGKFYRLCYMYTSCSCTLCYMYTIYTAVQY